MPTTFLVETIVNDNEYRPRPNLPAGLDYCKICGEPRGSAVDTSTELFDDEADQDRTIKVSCYCDAIECKKCGRKTRHRPLSDYFDIYSESFVHVPHFAAAQICRDCRSAEAKNEAEQGEKAQRHLRGLDENDLTKTAFYCHIRDGVIGRRNPDGTFDSLMPDGTWRRGVPEMNEFVCDEIRRDEVTGWARRSGYEVEFDFDAPPTEIRDWETGEFVPFTDEDQND